MLLRLQVTAAGEPLDLGPAPPAPTPLGTWSSDGSFLYFATTSDGNVANGYAIVDARSGGEPSVRHVPESSVFGGWAPDGGRYVVLSGSSARIIDASRPDDATLVELPPGIFWKARWSSDGRFIALTASDDPRIHVIDTEGEAPTLASYGGEGAEASGVHWSIGGRQLAYRLRSGSQPPLIQAMRLDLDAVSPAPARFQNQAEWSWDGREIALMSERLVIGRFDDDTLLSAWLVDLVVDDDMLWQP